MICPSCGAYAQQRWNTVHTVRNQASIFMIANCTHCDQDSLWRQETGQLIYPPKSMAPAPNADIPEPALGDYKEAAQILDASPRGAAALLRLALEGLLTGLGMKGPKLDDRIANAVEKGVPVRVQQAADTLRVTGNNAVHPGQIDLKDDRSTATSLFNLLNIIAEKLITEPREVEALFAGLPEGAKAAIRKRDAGSGTSE